MWDFSVIKSTYGNHVYSDFLWDKCVFIVQSKTQFTAGKCLWIVFFLQLILNLCSLYMGLEIPFQTGPTFLLDQNVWHGTHTMRTIGTYNEMHHVLFFKFISAFARNQIFSNQNKHVVWFLVKLIYLRQHFIQFFECSSNFLREEGPIN